MSKTKKPKRLYSAWQNGLISGNSGGDRKRAIIEPKVDRLRAVCAPLERRNWTISEPKVYRLGTNNLLGLLPREKNIGYYIRGNENRNRQPPAPSAVAAGTHASMSMSSPSSDGLSQVQIGSPPGDLILGSDLVGLHRVRVRVQAIMQCRNERAITSGSSVTIC